MGSYTRDQLEEWLQKMYVEVDKVIDVGGKQLPVKGRTRSWEVKDYSILDLPEYDLNIEQSKTDNADVIFCLEVSEYLYNPLQALKNINKLLRKGGVLCMSFHFIYPINSNNDYLRYTENGIRKLLEETGFEVGIITPRKEIIFENCNLEDWFGKQEMNGRPNQDKSIIGYLIKAKKI